MVERKVLLSLLAATALAGCSSQTGEPPAAPDTADPGVAATTAASTGAVAAPGAVLARLPTSKVGDGAALVGELDLAGGCVSVLAGGKRFVIASTDPALRFDPAANGLRLSDGTLIGSGQRVMLGGSQWQGGAPPWVVEPAASCGTAAIWVASSVSAAR